MSLDFNITGGGGGPPSYDQDELSRGLAACADRWVPEIFPRGRIENGEWRLADIGGAAPRKTGSCIVQLAGDHAGSYFDHSLGHGGGPLATLKDGLGIAGLALLERAAEIVAQYGHGIGKPNGHARPARSRAAADHVGDAAFILEHAGAPQGTPVETYFIARGLVLPPSSDLRFHSSLTDWRDKIGRPAMVAVVRYPDGSATGGIHRTYLQDDGSAHIGGPKAKMMLGPCDGGVVMLAPIGADGMLGIGEGIETTTAAMQMFNAPGWAALSAGGMRKFGGAIAEGRAPKALRSLLVWADAGKDGIAAAEDLVRLAASVGLPARLCIPRGSDDFADDLEKGLGVLPEQELIAPSPVEAPSLTRDSSPSEIAAAIRQVATARLDPISQRQALEQIRLKTRLPIKIVESEFKAARRELGLESKSVEQRGPGWLSKLALWDSGEPKGILLNIATVLREASEWIGVVGFDEFAGRIALLRAPPWADSGHEWVRRHWNDHDELKATEWMQIAGIHEAKAENVFRAVEMVAGENAFHPVRNYLNQLVWDRQPRLDTWLTYYLGADDTLFVRGAGACCLISAVARVINPGAKADCALILEGRQGIRKSTALRTIGDPCEEGWFTDEIADLGSKDAAMQMRGIWMIELAELDGMSRAEVDRVKAFMSRSTDHYRPPYGRQVIDSPRQCIFVGSVNDDEYLRDPTGARRFWPVACTSIDIDFSWRDRDQLWAEAIARFRLGERWWLHDEDTVLAAVEAQDERRQVDAWEDVIAQWLHENLRSEVRMSEVLVDALMITDRSKWSRWDQMRVGNCLKQIGYKRLRQRIIGTEEREYIYKKDG